MKWRELLDFLPYNRSERRGIFLFLLLILGFILWRSYRDKWSTPQISEQEKQEFLSSVASLKKLQLKEKKETTPTRPDSLFEFDPNNLSTQEWKKLGLTGKQAEVIENYQEAGGNFRFKEDLKKMYTVDDELYSKLETYIDLPSASNAESSKKRKTREDIEIPIDPQPFDPNKLTKEGWMEFGFSEKEAEVILNFKEAKGGFDRKEDLEKVYTVSREQYENLLPYMEIEKDSVKEGMETNVSEQPYDLNTIEKSTLMRIPGFDAWLADRTLKYRDLLGGYTHLEQLKEVYGLDEEKFERVAQEDWFKIKDDSLQQLDINSATIEELVAHPYITDIEAEKIIRVRKKYRKYESVEDLRKLDLFSEEKYSKIVPYLKAGIYDRN